MLMVSGTMLNEHDRAYVLAAYVHRHMSKSYQGNAHWLKHTLFVVRKDGRLDQRYRHCQTTYPEES